jgi:hypothetical protein
MQPTIELSSPINKVETLAPVQKDDSFFTSLNRVQSGVAAAFNGDVAIFAKGAWSLDVCFSGMFTGTTNTVLVADSIALVDPDGAAQALLGLPRVTGAQANQAPTFRFVFQRDGFKLQIQTGATVGGDALVMLVSVNARRSL